MESPRVRMVSAVAMMVKVELVERVDPRAIYASLPSRDQAGPFQS